jgi:glycine cleavage system aminomethyltransferase T
MLREDGMVMDDGTAWRLEEQRYLLTSSTGGETAWRSICPGCAMSSRPI